MVKLIKHIIGNAASEGAKLLRGIVCLVLIVVSPMAINDAVGAACTPAANDDCVNAIALVVDAAPVSGSTCGTLEGGEGGGCSEGLGDQSVWYSFVATSTEMTTNVVSLGGGGCCLAHALWDGSGGCLPTVEIFCDGRACSPTQTQHGVTGLTVSATYYIQIYYGSGGPCGSEQTFDVDVDDGLPPCAGHGGCSCAGITGACGNLDLCMDGTLDGATACFSATDCRTGSPNVGFRVTTGSASTSLRVVVDNVGTSFANVEVHLVEIAGCPSWSEPSSPGQCQAAPFDFEWTGLLSNTEYTVFVSSSNGLNDANTQFGICIKDDGTTCAVTGCGAVGGVAGNAYGIYAADGGATISSDEITATAGTGGTACLVCTPTDDAYTSVAISGYPNITVEPFNCTGVAIDFTSSTGGGSSWDFGAGAAPPTGSGSPVLNVLYSTTSRKTITESAGTYTGFVNISMAAPSSGSVLGTATGCPGTYSYSSSEAGTPGYSYAWTIDAVGTDAPVAVSPIASTTDIAFVNNSGTDNVYNVRLDISSECCGPLTQVVYPVTISSLPAAPGVLEAAPTKCIGGSKTIEVSPVTAGYNYNWYDASTGGTLQGSGATLTISSVVDGPVSYWVEAITAGGCVSGTRTEVALDGTNSPPTTDSPSQCAAGIQTITVTNPVVGAVYNWYSDVGLTVNVQSGTAITYDLNVPTAPSSANVYVTVTETGCAASTGTTATATTTGGSVATITWIGVTSVDWFTASNWYPACVPGCTDIVRLDIEADGYATPPAFMPEIAWVGAGGGGVACAKDIRIQTGMTLTMLAGDNKAVLEVNGDWKLCGAFVANSGMVRFTGTAAQSIGGTQTTTFNVLVINNTSTTGVTLTKPIIVTGSVAFNDGNLFTDATNYITINDNASSTSGSSISFVDGPIKKIGDDAFVFPTGDGTRWARIAITAPAIATTQYTAQYYAADPNGAGYTTTSMGAILTAATGNVSTQEYWDLAQGINNDDVGVKLYWENSAWSGINDCDGTPDDLRVAHWAAGQWQVDVDVVNLNGACPTSGWVQTSGNQPNFSPFAFASKSAVLNPLPIKLMYFTALYNKNTKNVDLDWATNSEINNDFFTVESSTNGTEFGLVVTVPGAGTSNERLYYEAIDTDPYRGISYYRLKQTDFDMGYQYSDIVVVNVLEGLKFSVRPNPARDFLEIKFGEIVNNMVYVMTPDYRAQMKIYDARGTVVYEKTFEGTFYKFNIDISRFERGMYIVSLLANGDSYMAKFIKE
ncbi:MAG: T9SS type A sorting domain-containing protein [Flavobacteriales bacterium]|nr:T9SS type A sorting domain-containing protein [Flavobacteriales bacterium]